jgi:HEAT repeat protein
MCTVVVFTATLALSFGSSEVCLSAADDQNPPSQSDQVKRWLEQLGSDDHRLFNDAVSKLGKADPAVIPALLEMLESDNVRVRQGAVMVLERLGPAAAGSLPALRRAIKTEADGQVRGRALLSFTLISLGLNGPYDFDVAPLPKDRRLSQDVKAVLLDALSDRSGFVRCCATFALSRAGPDPKVVDALLKLFRDNRSFVRARAAQSLGQLAADDPRVLPGLSKLFRDPDREGMTTSRQCSRVSSTGRGNFAGSAATNPSFSEGMKQRFLPSWICSMVTTMIFALV